MLGEIDDELMEILGVDVIALSPSDNMFGIKNYGELKEFRWKTIPQLIKASVILFRRLGINPGKDFEFFQLCIFNNGTL